MSHGHGRRRRITSNHSQQHDDSKGNWKIAVGMILFAVIALIFRVGMGHH